MTPEEMRAFYAGPVAEAPDDAWQRAHEALLDALERGDVRAAERDPNGAWRPNAWVKEAILAGFRRSAVVPMTQGGVTFFDKAAYPVRAFRAEDGVRVVPGGTAVRRGAHVARGVVIMPPSYVNVGAYVGEGTMIDSHALVGSCAQVGARVHLSAGAQIGGVLEPAGARPVVIEDDCFVGGLCGVFEGVVVRRHAVLAAGVILTASTVIRDDVLKCEHKGEIPERAVVVPGRIVKYRDARTDAATALEGALR